MYINDSVKLPQLAWFVNLYETRYVTNVYSGSLGTDPSNGCINNHTFNYKVYVDMIYKKESDFYLIAEIFIAPPWNVKKDKIVYSKRFPCSDDGVSQAEQWIHTIAVKNEF